MSWYAAPPAAVRTRSALSSRPPQSPCVHPFLVHPFLVPIWHRTPPPPAWPRHTCTLRTRARAAHPPPVAAPRAQPGARTHSDLAPCGPADPAWAARSSASASWMASPCASPRPATTSSSGEAAPAWRRSLHGGGRSSSHGLATAAASAAVIAAASRSGGIACPASQPPAGTPQLVRSGDLATLTPLRALRNPAPTRGYPAISQQPDDTYPVLLHYPVSLLLNPIHQ